MQNMLFASKDKKLCHPEIYEAPSSGHKMQFFSLSSYKSVECHLLCCLKNLVDYFASYMIETKTTSN